MKKLTLWKIRSEVAAATYQAARMASEGRVGMSWIASRRTVVPA